MSTFGCTRAEAVRICQDGPRDRDRRRSAALLQRLREGEAALTRDGDPGAAVRCMLRELVLAVRELAGSGWITARASDPQVAAFIALNLLPQPPAPVDLDQALAGVLRVRFTARTSLMLTDTGRRPGLSAGRQDRPVAPRQAAGC